MRERHVAFDRDGSTAWFDEVLENEKYGLCRGSGVLVLRDDAWRIAQYNLTFLVPNELVEYRPLGPLPASWRIGDL